MIAFIVLHRQRSFRLYVQNQAFKARTFLSLSSYVMSSRNSWSRHLSCLVLLCSLIPWDEPEETFPLHFNPTSSTPAQTVRLAFGELQSISGLVAEGSHCHVQAIRRTYREQVYVNSLYNHNCGWRHARQICQSRKAWATEAGIGSHAHSSEEAGERLSGR